MPDRPLISLPWWRCCNELFKPLVWVNLTRFRNLFTL